VRMILIGIMVLAVPVLACAQSQPSTEELRIALLEKDVALLNMRQATLEAQAARLSAERQLLQLQIDALQRELSETHGCDFDLAARACRTPDDDGETQPAKE
jgi:septal ring factor EnvC (AmiA/AmiB activator)